MFLALFYNSARMDAIILPAACPGCVVLKTKIVTVDINPHVITPFYIIHLENGSSPNSLPTLDTTPVGSAWALRCFHRGGVIYCVNYGNFLQSAATVPAKSQHNQRVR